MAQQNITTLTSVYLKTRQVAVMLREPSTGIALSSLLVQDADVTRVGETALQV